LCGPRQQDIRQDSRISYQLDDELVQFEYDEDLRSLNCKTAISPAFRSLCAVELPMPHGERFRYFQTVSDADTDIRRQIILEEYAKPQELIDFLSESTPLTSSRGWWRPGFVAAATTASCLKTADMSERIT